jgi:hypothetical protein
MPKIPQYDLLCNCALMTDLTLPRTQKVKTRRSSNEITRTARVQSIDEKSLYKEGISKRKSLKNRKIKRGTPQPAPLP